MKIRFMSVTLPLAFAITGSMLSAGVIGGPGSLCPESEGARYSLTYDVSPVTSTSTWRCDNDTWRCDDDDPSSQNSTATSVTPEPASYLLFTSGLLALSFVFTRRKKAQARIG